MAKWDDQLDKIKQVIKIMNEHNLVEVEIKQDDDKIVVKKGQPAGAPPQIVHVPVAGPSSPAVSSAGEAAAPASGPGQPDAASQGQLTEIKSPLVGTFYAKPSPDSEPCVEVGSQVEEQTVVCIIEAMKVMNEIKAEVSGTVVEVVATNGQAVEYGQVLFKVKPD